MDAFRDPIFRGCTRPAMCKGVPWKPLLGVSGAFLLLAVWLFYLVSPYVTLYLAALYLPLVLMMREITRKDDQRLRQMGLRLQMRLRMAAARKRWGACSYSPLRYRRRS